MKRLHRIGLLTIVLMAAAILPGTAHAADSHRSTGKTDMAGESRSLEAAAPYYEHIRNWNSDKCLAVPGGSKQAGTGIIQWTCGEWVWDHRWTFEPTLTQGLYRIRNYNSDQCLAVPGASGERDTQVIQWPCGNYPDHFWWVDLSGNVLRIINYNSNQCLAVRGGSRDDGAAVIQYTCGSCADHSWYRTAY